MRRTLLRLAVLAILSLSASCAPCRDYARSVHASASVLERFTHAGIDTDPTLSPDTRLALHDEAADLTRAAAIAAGGAR